MPPISDDREAPGPAAPPPPHGARRPTPDLPAVPPGSRLEQLLLLTQLLTDLASVPFHLAVYLFTRRRQRRRLQQALTETRR